MIKHLLTTTLLVSTFSFAQCPLNDQAILTDDFTKFCEADTTIDIFSSQVGVDYFLRDDADDSVIDGPVAGTGSSISFSTGTVNSNITYNVYANAAGSPNCLTFDNIDDEVALPDVFGLAGATEATVEAWVNSNGGIVQQGIIGRSNSFEFYRTSTGFLGATFYCGGDVQTATSIFALIPGVWYHVAAVYDGAGVTLYMDGDDVTGATSGSGSGFIEGTGFTAAIGSSNGSDFFDGEIDGVNVWNIARSETDIEAVMLDCPNGSEDGIVATYPFTDGAGSSLLSDLGPFAYTGTLSSMDPASDWIAGIACGTGCDLQMSELLTITIETEMMTALPDVTICEGDNALIFGQAENTAGVYYDTLTSSGGCDSILSQELFVTTVDAGVTFAGGTITADLSGAGVTYQWIDCSDDSPIAGATSQDYTPTANGDYAVIVMDASGCSDTSVCTNISDIGISEANQTAQWSFYPNPASTELQITVQSNHSESITILNTLGKKVYAKSKTTNQVMIDCSNWPTGVYFIQIGSQSRKLVIRR